MIVNVSNKIKVEKPTQEVITWCKENLVIPNPEFYELERMGKWAYRVPRDLVLYEQVGSDIYIPFGMFARFCKTFGKECEFKNDIVLLRKTFYGSNIKLYDYQETAVNAAIKARNGIIVMPCGAGKTQTALELISRLGGRCLWLTHTQDLLNQSYNRATSTLSIFKDSYGKITGGKVNIGVGITFATVQTMVNLDLSLYKDAFDIIIVDECHKAVGSPTKMMQFYKVVSSLSARYKFGVTATPDRKDGLSKSMYALLGDKIIEIDKSAVKNTTCEVRAKLIYTDYMPDPDSILQGDGTICYASLIKDLTCNEERNEQILDVLNKLDGATLVLSSRVEHLKTLQAGYTKKSVCLSALGASKAARNVRKQALKDLNDGNIDCIFATYQLAKEGLDVPNLRHLVFATPEKDDTTVTQSIGRVGRKADGKEYGTVHDFRDDRFGLIRRYGTKRDSIYKRLGIKKYIDI